MPNWTHLLKGKGDLWWTGAINLGAKYAINKLKCDFILLWNDDVVADEFYFDQLSEFSFSNKYDVLGSLVLYSEDRDIVHSYGGFLTSLTVERAYTTLEKINTLLRKKH